MPTNSIEGLPSAAPAAESWPRNELGDDHPLGLQADEMFTRQLDTGFAGEVRGLVNDPATGLAGRDPEAALAGIAGTIPLLAELKDRYLSQAIGPRQKALLEPLIDRRLDRAGGDLGRIVAQATSVLDDRIVAERLADLQQDASLSWQDPSHLRTLGRTVVGELRYQCERNGWDAVRTDTAVRTGLSDLYAGAVEAALAQDPERAAKLYVHARDVIQPERQAAVERRIDRAREERRVTEIVGGLADTPDDSARRPDPDDYQARAAEATPPDASPEVRAQVSRMASIEQARVDRAWQASRGRAATGALDWLGANPEAPLMAMPADLRDGLSPEQTEALDRTAMNGGRVVTDRDLYDMLDDQAVRNPEEFAGLDLTQHRLSLGDGEYNRLTKLQQALAEGKSDPAFERHRLGRLFLGEGLRNANLDPNGEEGRTARQQLNRLVGAFEAVEGKPPTMADIRGLVGDVLPRVNGDPNIVRVGGEPAEANANTEIAQQQEPASVDESEPLQEAQNPQPKPTQPAKPQQAKPSTSTQPSKLSPSERLQLREKNWKEAIRKDLPNPLPAGWQDPLPDDWEQALTRINPDYLKWTKAAAEKNGIDPLLLARLFYKESSYNKDKGSNKGAKGIAQLTETAIKDLKLDPKTFKYDDPKASIDAGAALLSRYYRYFKDWPKAVGAYNRGIGNIHYFFIPTESADTNDQKSGLPLETSILLRYVFRGQPEAFDKSK